MRFLLIKVIGAAILCFVVLGKIVAQTSTSLPEFVISGVLLNADTNEPVPYASVGIDGSSLGTVTNIYGEFELHLPLKHKQSNLAISCIGFFKDLFPISGLNTSGVCEIKLKPRTYELNEVTVYANLSPEKIVQYAIESIPKNYIGANFIADGFYREYFKENGKYVAFAEAAISLYDGEGYASKKIQKEKELVSLDELRVSDIYNKSDYALYIDVNYALRSNIIRNVNYWKIFAQKFDVKSEYVRMAGITYDGDDLVYIIAYKVISKKRGNYEGKIFIRKYDFAVLRLEINADNRMKGRVVNGSPYKSQAIITYKTHEGKMCLSYIHASHDVHYEKSGNKFDLTFYSELFVNDIQTRGVDPVTAAEAMKPTSIFYQPRYRTYDPNFWEEYNLFFESPNNEQIIADLEARRPLEDQFKVNGKLKLKPTPIVNLPLHKVTMTEITPETKQ
ncbi:MAG: carboxypeptidase-like regulatory domain-containing protein [Chitinophagales bacterium]|nr:carboxypeptidase-like regulatory domain-containing protein [Sphingobacteriales bacterium]MCC7056340.1 carboxypeptidase-like regulatory domain-containing protein [Chitinophagales bacterium]